MTGIDIPPGVSGRTGLGVTGFAKGHKIIFSVGTAVINGTDMMDFINGYQTSPLKAFFTEGMLGYI